MNKEEIRCCINIATLDRKLPYKKILKEMKKEHLVDVCYELLKEHLALLDIKEYLKDKEKEFIDEPYYNNYWEYEHILDIVNKALGSDSNDE